MSRLAHSEVHMVHRIGWLRAAVLGANDGLVSTSSLVVGVAAAGSGKLEVLVAGLAGLVAGAMPMAAGEYVSVSSQTDAEQADLARETRELEETPEAELEELTLIYVERGLDRGLAEKVAVQLTERDALGSHARGELGIFETVSARPIQAALVSALILAIGAVIPLIDCAARPGVADRNACGGLDDRWACRSWRPRSIRSRRGTGSRCCKRHLVGGTRDGRDSGGRDGVRDNRELAATGRGRAVSQLIASPRLSDE